ncbi:ABC transporter permease [Acidicapsa acidisoli]|uniref:ABC transporter permease n=1 Tax=Acidicapsa acidisoli TaxID=1615681 RepID=UPI0021E02411|nr:ABC transporter permease [Acidicapsa acidisoli]
MRWLERVRIALRMLFHRQAEAARLQDELQFHLEQQINENAARGLTPDEARRAAIRSFGNPGLVREQARSTWNWNWLETLLRDVRYGMRTLMRSPGFTLVSVLVLMLGIGATTSLFTIVRAVLLKPLPFPDSDKLVMVYEHFRDPSSGTYFNVVSAADFVDWRRQTHGFEDMAAWRRYGFNLTGVHAELPEVVEAAGGSYNLFSVLGVRPVLGRTFTADEDRLEAGHVVMLTWSLFQRRFAGDPSILGKQIHLDSNSYTVVGVLPSWFTYPNARIQVWVPYAQTFPADLYAMHGSHQSRVVARLRPGVSADAATKEVSALQYQLHLAHASEPVAEDALYRPMIDDVVLDVKTPLLVLLSAVGCMLLIACLNVSNLLVARAASRRKEVAVRGALGGSRLALIREQMTESLLICAAGGSLGLLLSILATRWLASHWRNLPRSESIQLDGSVLAFTTGLIVLTALLAGLVPAISSTGKGVLGALQESSRSIGGSASRAWLRKTMLTAEIALTVILLVSAGLLFKSFLHLRTADLGCVTENVLTVKYGLPEKQYDTPEKVIAFHEALLDRVRRIPGVRAAALVSTPPGGGYEGDSVFTIPGRPAPTSTIEDDATTRTIDPSYFSVMQIPLIHGRFFTDHERLANYHYTIVNKTFADQYFPGEDPIGKRVNIAWYTNKEDFEIVGVVGDTLYDVAKPVKATMYFPILAGIPELTGSTTIMVRAAVDPLALSIPIQQQLAALDSTIPVYDVLTMQQILGLTTASQNLSATLVLAFAALSLLLAGVGLYGVLSYLVTQRVAEIGIRIALGAQRSEVLRIVLLDGLRPVALGLAIGLAGGATAGNLIRSILYGTSPFDPMVLVAMVGCLMLTAIVACAVPAVRASRIEPMVALRSE